MTTKISSNVIHIEPMFCEDSDAGGALLACVFITGSEDVDFNRSTFLTAERNSSLNHTLPYPGLYRIYLYDIEHDGTLRSDRVLYPAWTDTIPISREDKGMTGCENGQGHGQK